MGNNVQEYINKMRDAGKSDNEIKEELLKSGWRENDIPIQSQQQPMPQSDDEAIRFNYRLFTIGKKILVSSPIIFMVLLFFSFAPLHSFYISSSIVIIGWIITIPSAIAYSRKSKNKIDGLSWFIILLPIIVGILFYQIYIFDRDFTWY